jgi:hypothetical protein
MKPVALCILFSLCTLPFLAAQETGRVYPYALGAILELNQNTRERAALGYGASLDRYLPSEYLLAGIRGSLGTDFNGISMTEAAVYLRLYLFKPDAGGLYTQLGWGASFFREDGEDQRRTMRLDVSLGYRFFFLKGFYVEPYLCAGFPLRAGAGIVAGHWFDF